MFIVLLVKIFVFDTILRFRNTYFLTPVREVRLWKAPFKLIYSDGDFCVSIGLLVHVCRAKRSTSLKSLLLRTLLKGIYA